MRGDSFFVVNGEGKRVYNEKGAYDLRMRKHWDAPENKLLFMIGDQRCAAVSAGDSRASARQCDHTVL